MWGGGGIGPLLGIITRPQSIHLGSILGDFGSKRHCPPVPLKSKLGRREAAILRGSLCMFQSLPCRPRPMMDLRNQALKPLMLRALRRQKVGPPFSHGFIQTAPSMLQPVLSHALSSYMPAHTCHPSWLHLLLPWLRDMPAQCFADGAWAPSVVGAMLCLHALLASARDGQLCHV